MTKTEQQALAAVANALQTAAPLSTALRQGFGDAHDTTMKLEAAIDRAVTAMKRLQPQNGGAR